MYVGGGGESNTDIRHDRFITLLVVHHTHTLVVRAAFDRLTRKTGQKMCCCCSRLQVKWDAALYTAAAATDVLLSDVPIDDEECLHKAMRCWRM